MERWYSSLPKTLKECLHHIGIISSSEQVILNITNDSRECNEHSIYCGSKYALDALDKQAFVVDEKYLGDLINFFYDDPSHHYQVIGVTGTSGKTSMTSYLKQALSFLGYRCIRLGTQMNEFEDIFEESNNTTMNVMKNLDVFLKYIHKIDYIIMEISTHAIEENRISFIHFDRIIYTNITCEHLEYHQTFTHYKASKFKLRNYLKDNGKICIHYDHMFLHELLLYTRNIIPYGKKDGMNIQTNLFGSSFEYHTKYYQTNLIGIVQVMNLVGVLKCLESMNVSDDDFQDMIKSIQVSEGRMEVFTVQNRMIVIDYAHTVDALQHVCEFLSQQNKRIIGVMGCGGERDKLKRPIMASIISSYCDMVIITEDNNRNEEFNSILKDMELERFQNVTVEEKREKAVHLAFTKSNEHDIILLAGKGNEQFLIANGNKTPYNDKACILKYERG